jgi:hypothetical protein
MKRTATLIFLLTAIFLKAQDIDYLPLRIEYTRLPLNPLKAGVKNYQVIIIADYLQKIETQKADHMARSAKAESDYQAALKEYDETLKKVSAQHETDLNVWFRLTPQQQAVMPRPVMPVIPMPVKATVVEIVPEKTFNTDLLASTAVKLEGFNRLPENPAIIQVNLSGFENEEPKMITRTEKQKNAAGQSVDATVYVYQVNYRHIFKVKILQPDGKYIMDELYAPSAQMSTHTTKSFLTQSELQTYWTTNKNTELATLQEKAVNDNFKSLNDHLNNNHGFVKLARSVSVAYVDEKTAYDDLKEAMAFAKTGYGLIGDKNSFAAGETELRKAIAKWEAALAESNIKNKKARIDEDVTEAILMNLAEAHVWLNDFAKAQDYISRLAGFKLSMKEKGMVRNSESFMLDQKKRSENNTGKG